MSTTAQDFIGPPHRVPISADPPITTPGISITGEFGTARSRSKVFKIISADL